MVGKGLRDCLEFYSNISHILGKISDKCKFAHVLPIQNHAAHQTFVSIYHPILLSVLSKLLEKHAQNLLISHLENFHPLSAQQWALPMVSVLQELFSLPLVSGMVCLTLVLLVICAVFVDFSKAFDSVPHRPLIQKRKDLNVHPHVLKWTASALALSFKQFA